MNTIEQLQQALAAATPGEWKLQPWDHAAGGTIHTGELLDSITDFDAIVLEADCDDYTKSVIPDLRLIVAMHNALPALIECAKALDELLKLPVAKGELKLLDRGIGTLTENARWLDARTALAKLQGEQS